MSPLAGLAFASPWVLLALALLPVLWFLLRITPPAPRTERFPAIRLLLGLAAVEETPARTPLWLLLLRVGAAGLIVVGLARPVLNAVGDVAGSGPLLLVVDDGWAAAPDWPRRVAAADTALDRAERAGRRVALLATAPDEAGAAPALTPTMPPAELRARVAALRPHPWPSDRAAAAAALRGWRGQGAVYVADGLTDGTDWPAFAAALAAAGPLTVVGEAVAPARLMLPPRAESDRLVARIAEVPRPLAQDVAVLAQTGDGRTLARVVATVPAGAATAEAPIRLPPELRNRLVRLVIDGPPSAGSIALLDERWRRRPVGLLAGDAAAADNPLIGELFYLHRALEPYVELREGDLATLLGRELSVLILADRVVPAGPEQDRIMKWVEQGGLLVRFAGPRLAEQASADHPDALLPVRLLAGDRQLGGALSWSQPAALAPFPADSPFDGLAVPADVRVHRQVLAEPSQQLAGQTWARLADGTPLVTQAVLGAGRIVLFHVTANADWSDLPLSGLFVDMLRRLVDLSVGVAPAAEAGGVKLAPVETLDGFGEPGAPPPVAAALTAAELGRVAVSPRHPPGFYGPENGRRALNLANGLALPAAAPLIAGAAVEGLGGVAPERALAPWLLGMALALFAVDLLISLGLRGLLRRRIAAGAAALLLVLAATPAPAQKEPPPNPALVTRLAYIVTGDAQTDAVSRAGLIGLSDYVNRRTNAALGEPAAVTPGQDELIFYPFLYWPIDPGAVAMPAAGIAALNNYMAEGGIILIDTRDGGSGEGMNAGAAEALRQVGAAGLVVPPLAPLTPQHVLAHAFYLLQDFPGRFDGAEVWVQRDQDRSNDSVSPVIIGGHDWAAAWATDAEGRNPYAVIPGGARQRTLAYRFGVNLVMYALTGNYKGDQVHVPAILERLGQ
jgi:hypothetical protein